MYRHILVSTDGSKLSGKAIRTAVRLADATGAKVTGVFVTAPFTAPAYGEGVMYMPAMSPKRYKEVTEREARKAQKLADAVEKAIAQRAMEVKDAA